MAEGAVIDDDCAAVGVDCSSLASEETLAGLEVPSTASSSDCGILLIEDAVVASISRGIATGSATPSTRLLKVDCAGALLSGMPPLPGLLSATMRSSGAALHAGIRSLSGGHVEWADNSSASGVAVNCGVLSLGVGMEATRAVMTSEAGIKGG